MGKHALSDPMKHTWVSSLDRKYDDREALLRAAVTLWAKGLDVDLHQAITDYSACP